MRTILLALLLAASAAAHAEKYTVNSPNDFIRLLRLKQAARLLRQEQITVSAACYEVGFSSTSYFSHAFQQQFGMTPAEFRQGGESREEYI